jgi:hypothetical protein
VTAKELHNPGSAPLTLFLVVVATTALVIGMAGVSARESSATPPPDVNNTACVQHLLCCCPRLSDGTPGELQTFQWGDPRGSAGPIDRQPSHSGGGVVDGRGAVSLPAQPDLSERVSTSDDRPRRSESAPALPSVLFVASTMSPERVFETGFPADLRTMGLRRYLISEGNNGLWTTPTSSARVAYEDVVDPRCRPRPNQLVWVYEIRADEQFYDLSESLNYSARRRNTEPTGGSPARANRAHSRALWMTLSEIPTENIRRAFPITERTPIPRGFQQPFPLETAIRNRNYVRLNTHGSEQLLTWPSDWVP